MRKRDERNRTHFGLKCDHCSIENGPGSTHPGAEERAMCGSLMMGMVPGMLDRLRLCQSADRKNTECEENRQELEDSVAHQQTTQLNRHARILMEVH